MPYQPLQLAGFTKVNESLAPDKIQPSELTQLTNAVLSKAGSIYNPAKRGGFRGVYSSSTQKMGMRPYWADIIEDETGTKVPIACGYTGTAREIRVINGGVWSTRTYPATTLTGGNTLPIRYTKFNKKLFITDLYSPPFQADGQLFENGYTLELQKPDVSTVAVYTATGGYLEASKNYAYIITYKDDYGNQSAPSQPIYVAFPPSSDYKVRLTGIPTPTDSRVTRIVVYRTEADGKVFYQHSTLITTTTELTDNKRLEDFEDSGAIISYTRIPKKSMYVATHRDRVWWGNNTIELSNPYSPPFIQHTVPVATLSGWTAQPTIAYQDGTAGSGVSTGRGGSVTDVSAGTYLETDSYYKWWVYAKSVDGQWSKDRMVIIGKTILDAVHPTYKYPFAFPCWSAMIGASGITEKECTMIKVFRSHKQTSLLNAQEAGEPLKATMYEVGTFDTSKNTYSETATHAQINMFWDFTPDSSLTVAFSTPTNSDEVLDSSLIFSDVAKPNTYLYEDIRFIDTDNGGKITGIFDDGNGLVVFKERAIYKVFTTGSKYNWEVIKLVEDIGCNDPYSLAKQGNVYFFRYGKSFYMWQSGAQPQEISKDFRKTFEWVTQAYASVATERYYAVSAGYNDGQGGGNVASIYIFDFSTQCWYTFTTPMVAEVLFADKFSDPVYGATNALGFNNLLGAVVSGNNGFLAKYSDSNTQDENYAGTPVDISPIIKTKKFIFPDEFYVARLRELFLKILRESTSAVSVTISADDGTQTLSFTTGTSDIYARNFLDTELHRCRNLQITISGVGLKEFKSLRLDYRPERREYGR